MIKFLSLKRVICSQSVCDKYFGIILQPGCILILYNKQGPDSNFPIPDSWSIPDPGSASKNLGIFNPCF